MRQTGKDLTCPQILVTECTGSGIKRGGTNASPERGYAAIKSKNSNSPSPDTRTDSLLPIYSILCNVDVYLSCAFVTIRTSFLNTTGGTISGSFSLPTPHGQATISSCDICFAGKTFSSSIIDPNKTKVNHDPKLASASIDGGRGEYSPHFFSMPFHNCPPNCEIVVIAKYLQDMTFHATTGEYSIPVPLTIPPADEFGRGGIYQNMPPDQVIFINCTIDPGNGRSDLCKWYSSTHPFVQVTNTSHPPQSDCITLALNRDSNIANTNLCLTYGTTSAEIIGACLLEPPKGDDTDGAFALLLSPPSPSPSSSSSNSINSSFGRNLVFLLDRSGSMGSGTCMSTAKSALTSALDKLSPQDNFAISAFDHRQIWYHPSFSGDNNNHDHAGGEYLSTAAQIFPATPENIASAKHWIQGLRAQGGTDILQPYSTSCQMLSESVTGIPFQQWSQPFPQLSATASHGQNPNLGIVSVQGDDRMISNLASTSNGSQVKHSNLPFVVLITDGAVPNEAEICKYASQFNECLGVVTSSDFTPLIRTYTFGIGPYANKYFLKMLASNGFGYSDTCISEDNLDTQMNVFMNRTYLPLMSDLKLSADNTAVKMTFQPHPIPDLTVGSPLMIVGTYQGPLDRVSISGYFKGGKREVVNIVMRKSPHVPVRQLVARHQMGILVGEWWLTQSQNPEQAKTKKVQAVDIAVKTSTPCMFAAVIAYETVPRNDIVTATALPVGPPPPPQAIAVPVSSPEGVNPSGSSSSSSSSSFFTHHLLPGSSSSDNKNQHHRNVNPKIIGGAVLLGATATAAIAFGSIAATSSNASVAGAMAQIVSGADWMGQLFDGMGGVDLSSVNINFDTVFGDMSNGIGGGGGG